MKYLTALLGAVVVLLLVSNAYYIKENAELKVLNDLNTAVVDNQNKAILDSRLNTEAYTCDLETINEYTKSKYEQIIHEHENDSCELKLKSLEQALHIFNN